MIEQDKQLLLKDLCARLPYGVKVRNVKLDFYIYDFNYNVKEIKTLIEEYDIKPYLRPMSSMSIDEEQREAYLKDWGSPIDYIDFCLSHHMDYRGLIEKGLALEAPDGMYKIVTL